LVSWCWGRNVRLDVTEELRELDVEALCVDRESLASQAVREALERSFGEFGRGSA